AALYRAEGHLDAALAAGEGRAAVAVRRRRRSSALIDRGPPPERSVGAEERDRHARDDGGRTAVVRHQRIVVAPEGDHRDGTEGHAAVDIVLEEIERRGRHGREYVSGVAREVLGHPPAHREARRIDALRVDTG